VQNSREKSKRIKRFLLQAGWVNPVDEVRFLAAGEYNENYVVRSGGDLFVLRINHGSQLALDDQIEYEFRVLKAVEPSGVTPRVHAVEPRPPGLDGGALLMDYIEGGPFDYHRDRDGAAKVFARIHALPVPEDCGLIVQRDPVSDIAAESYGLLHRYENHPLKRQRTLLLDYHQSVRQLARETEGLFENESLCLVNSEVNSGNFIVGDGGVFLVDWEKAVVSYRYQDLGHFLVPTSTRWKQQATYSDADKRAFLAAYRDAIGSTLSLEELKMKSHVLEKTILLRALSWCFMAYYEYTQTERAIRNEETFRKIEEYMVDIECLLE